MDSTAKDEIEELASVEGYGKMAFGDWLVFMGFPQLDKGFWLEAED
ncbi:MAG: hypothetical protein KJ069_23005 [Anaerolineae bacterium]|nr:hypothetical protein [Anaerolineae bacterium]